MRIKPIALLLFCLSGSIVQAQDASQTTATNANANGFETNLKHASHQHLMAPTAFQQPKRTGSITSTNLLYNRLDLGFSDYVSASAGLLLSPVALPCYVSLKATYPIYPNLRVGGQILGNTQFVDDSYLTSTIHRGYGITTTAIAGYGSEDYNINLSGSYIAGNGTITSTLKLWDFTENNELKTYRYGSTWMASVSGFARATNRLGVFAEYNVFYEGYLVAGGLRFESKGQNAFDLGLFSSTFQNYPLPFFSYSFSF